MQSTIETKSKLLKFLFSPVNRPTHMHSRGDPESVMRVYPVHLVHLQTCHVIGFT